MSENEDGCTIAHETSDDEKDQLKIYVCEITDYTDVDLSRRAK